MLRDFLEKRFNLAVLTCASSLVLQYIRTTNRLTFDMLSSAMVALHGDDSSTKASVTPGYASHVFHADFFP